MTAPHVTHIQADVRVPRPKPAGARRGDRWILWDVYRVGWMAEEGWFCTCETRGRCEHIRAALAVVSEEGK